MSEVRVLSEPMSDGRAVELPSGALPDAEVMSFTVRMW
jgi:hypothetical protein